MGGGPVRAADGRGRPDRGTPEGLVPGQVIELSRTETPFGADSPHFGRTSPPHPAKGANVSGSSPANAPHRRPTDHRPWWPNFAPSAAPGRRPSRSRGQGAGGPGRAAGERHSEQPGWLLAGPGHDDPRPPRPASPGPRTRLPVPQEGSRDDGCRARRPGARRRPGVRLTLPDGGAAPDGRECFFVPDADAVGGRRAAFTAPGHPPAYGVRPRSALRPGAGARKEPRPGRPGGASWCRGRGVPPVGGAPRRGPRGRTGRSNRSCWGALWWGGWDSNPRPTDYESAALTG